MGTVVIVATCSKCGLQLSTEAFEDGDERTWVCPECGEGNVSYWDDDPAGKRGWS